MTLATLSQPTAFTIFNQGGGLMSGGDVFFGGGNAVNFTISTGLDFTAYGITLQIKRSSSTAGLADAAGFSPILTINGLTISHYDEQNVVSSPSPAYSVTTYYWGASLAGLTNTGTSNISVAISNPASQRLIDGFALDAGPVAAVPEPSSGLLVICALGALALVRRHRKTETLSVAH
jgi:hypothetical protein